MVCMYDTRVHNPVLGDKGTTLHTRGKLQGDIHTKVPLIILLRSAKHAVLNYAFY
jgi:hypothetical protein